MRRPRCLDALFFALALVAAVRPAGARAATIYSTACCGYTLSGVVFNDINADGIQNGSDYGLAGWTIEARDNANVVVATTTSAAGGAYSIQLSAPYCGAQITLREVLKSGWTRTFPGGAGTHTGTHTGCGASFGPFDFGNTQSCPGFQKTYTTDADFYQGTLDGVVTNVNQLELSQTGSTFPYAWVANTNEGTVSKVSTLTGREVARYRTGPPKGQGGYAWLMPSRTVVDKDGNCWVANRAFLDQGSITEILATGGIDRNNSSLIETSADLDNDGKIASPGELLPWGQDERVVRHYLVGGTDDRPRGMVFDKTGSLWVGLFTSARVIKLDPNLSLVTYSPTQTPSAPSPLVTVNTAPHHCYGLALSPSGKIYGATCNVTAFEIDPGLASGGTAAGPALTKYIQHPASNNYGIVVDRNCIVWLAKLSDNAGNYGCIRWNPALTTTPPTGWTNSSLGAGAGGRGITCDFNGNIWMSLTPVTFNSPSYVARYTNAGTWVANYPAGVSVPVGIGVCSDGNIIVTGNGSDNWNKLSNVTGAPINTGGPQTLGNQPYSYSDFTGSVQSLVNQQLGIWSVITDGGNAGLSWTIVSWNKSTPANTAVTVDARAAQSLPALANAAWTGVTTSGALANPLPGRYIETRVRMTRSITTCAPPFVTPILYDLTVAAVCDTCNFQACPPDTFVACQTGTGAQVNYTPPAMGPGCGPNWTVTCTPPPGSFFPVGPTSVHCQAVSAQGDTVDCYFTVTVTGNCASVPQGGCCIGSQCITTSEASCLAQGGIYLGDNAPCTHACTPGCLKPPFGMTAWFPLDGGSGASTPNLANAALAGTLVSAPTPVSGQKVIGCYDFNGTSSYVTAPDGSSLDINAANFTIDAWVRNGNPGLQPICDKRDASPIQGYAFFLVDGYPGLQLATGGSWTNLILNPGNSGVAGSVGDGNWHLVAVTVERASTSGVQFYVDGQPVGPAFDPTAHQGLLGSQALFQIARSYPILNTTTYYHGMIDELEIFRRVLSASEITDLWNANANGKCREAAYASRLVCCLPGGGTNSTITICNYSGASHLYSWGLTGVVNVPGCTGPPVTSFVPASGTVTVPAGSCLTIPVNVPCPTAAQPGQVSCYQLSVFNHDTGALFGAIGSVKRPVGWCANWTTQAGDPVIGPVEINPGQAAHLRLTASYDEFGDAPAVFSYQITAYAGDTETPNDLVSLNGLPAGSSIAATIVTPPGGHVSVDVDVNYTGDQPLTVDRLVALVDDDQNGIPEPVAEAGLTTSLPSVVVSVPPPPTSGLAGDETQRSFVSLPNPFVPSSRIAFRVDGPGQVQVSLGVYDVNGRMVRMLYDDFYMKPGVHVVDWDGTDSHGARLGAGMFFLKLEAGERTDAAKIVLIR